jgi:hypothetical protein
MEVFFTAIGEVPEMVKREEPDILVRIPTLSGILKQGSDSVVAVLCFDVDEGGK